MPKAYSNDLRRRILEAHDQGQGSLKELATLFSVSYGYTIKIAAQRRQSGQMERVERRRPRPRVAQTVEAALRQQLAQIPVQSRTVTELWDDVLAASGLTVSYSYFWLVLRRMGVQTSRAAAGAMIAEPAQGGTNGFAAEADSFPAMQSPALCGAMANSQHHHDISIGGMI